MTTPASSMEAAVGAATWPVGAQVWKGHMPARIREADKDQRETPHLEADGQAGVGEIERVWWSASRRST